MKLSHAGLLLAAALPLLAAASDQNEQLWAAARLGDASRVAELLAQGADPNAEFREGGTALHFAAQRGYDNVVRVLLEHGADVQATERLNQTSALHFAIGHPETVKVLMSHGADVNARDMQVGQAPLWWAVVKGDQASAEILLASGSVDGRALREALAAARKGGRTALAAAIEGALAKTISVTSWPQFRGPAGAGVADGQHPPLRFGVDPPANLQWNVSVPGLGHSSPVVWQDRVFVTTAVSSSPEPTDFRPGSPMESARDMSPHSLRVLCFDRLTGKLLWSSTAFEGVPHTKRSTKNSFATPTPATDGKHLVVMFGSHGLYCYGLDGKLLWKRDLGVIDSGFFFDPEYQWGDASSPILYGNLVILQCDQQKGSFLAAFDLDTGEPRWSTPRDELPSWSSPALYRWPHGVELVTNGVKAIRGYDPETGKERWSLKTGNSLIAAPTPVGGLGLIVVTNGYRPMKPIYAIHPGAAGDISLGDETASRWVVWSKKSGGSYYITPLIYGEHLYLLNESGVLTSYYLKTGEQIYRQRVGDSGATFSSSPVAADGYVFLASESGEVYVVRDGIEFQLAGVNPVGEPCMATPAIAGGMIFVRTTHHLYAFGASPPPARGGD